MQPLAMDPATTDSGLVPYPDADVARYRRSGDWAGRTLPAELVSAARRNWGHTALVTEDESLTYAGLFDRAAAFAGGLAGISGVEPGQAVMFQMGNTAESVTAYLGSLMAGLRPVCTLPHHGVREIGLLAEHVGSDLLLSQADFGRGRAAEVAHQLLEEGKVGRAIAARGSIPKSLDYATVLDAGQGAELDELPWARLDANQIALFQLSGGTTGLPKVAPRLHEEYVCNSRLWAERLDLSSKSVVLYPLPLMHNAGIALALQPVLLTGGCLVLTPSADVEVIHEQLIAQRPDVMPLVPPAVAIRMLDSGIFSRDDMACVRDFVVGGQRLPVEIAERLSEELGISVRQMFGMAEGMFLLTPADADETLRHHTIGSPLSALDEVRVLVPDGETEVPDGDIGEFAARGPYTIRGYYRADQHNSTAFTADGFYRTGDLARRHVHPQGVYYSIEGRIKDVINRGVEKIHAEEVEELIMRHPDVINVAVVAMPDSVLGERACAYLILEPGRDELTVSTLGAFLLENGVAKYKLPERVEIIDAFPMTNVGKVSKKALRDHVAERLEGTR